MPMNWKKATRQNDAGAGQAPRRSRRHQLMVRLLLTAVIMFFGMSAYQFLEHFMLPWVTPLQSDIINVLLSTMVATVVAYFVINKSYTLLEQLSEENFMRRTSEEMLSKLFRANPDWVIIGRLSDGSYIDVNEAFLRMTGYTKEEITGHSSLDLGIWVDPEERNKLIDALRKEGRVSNHEVTYRMKSGQTRFMLQSAELIDLSGQECIISVCKDITALKLAAEERERLVNQLGEALSKVMQLSGFLPICTSCKRVRDNHGHWSQLDPYIHNHKKAKFRHSICPECAKEVHAKIFGDTEIKKAEGEY